MYTIQRKILKIQSQQKERDMRTVLTDIKYHLNETFEKRVLVMNITLRICYWPIQGLPGRYWPNFIRTRIEIDTYSHLHRYDQAIFF